MRQAKKSQRSSKRGSQVGTAFRQLRAALDDLEGVLAQQEASAASSLPEQLARPSEYASHLRVRVKTVRDWLKQGLPHLTVEGKARIPTREADDWVRARQESQS
jgi:hypothetical protein